MQPSIFFFLASACSIEARKHDTRLAAMGLKIRANNSDSKGMHARAGVFMGPYIAAAAEGNGSVVEVQARIMQGNTTYKPPRRRRRKPFIKWKQKWNLDRKKQHSKKYVTKFSTDFVRWRKAKKRRRRK
mmetsp:Transcript_105178/g.166002  ORF Transcript_105178/g.166002 Transcript_105178/m.166002 type:complete len:129 (-) Transcript_105178:156-542(-)